MQQVITVHPPAKINLHLSVCGRRDDGYHDISTVIQAIELTDTMVFEYSSTLKLAIEPIGSVPAEPNLVMEAACALKKFTGVTHGAAIRLRKGIPVSAGLGGGSSDAAATLVALNRLWNTKLSKSELNGIAIQLGSDVPFFLYGGTAVASKRGDQIEILPSPYEKFALVIENHEQTIASKTQQMYKLIQPEHYSLGHNRSKDIRRLLSKGVAVASSTYNIFDLVAHRLYGNYKEMKLLLKGMGVTNLTLAGSGPSFFSLFENYLQGLTVQKQLSQRGIRSHLAPLLHCDHHQALFAK